MEHPDARPASPIDGRFHLQEEAGRGGMGVVWKAWDQAHQAWVAVKVLHVMRPTVTARFDREIRLLEGMQHPYVVRYQDRGQLPDGRRYLVMEWVEGETLAQRLHRGALSLDEAIELGRKLASALGAAHRQGVVHRDFKPSNVLLVGHDLQQPRLLDFGIARDVESQTHLTASEAILGTPGYVAPEQARSSRLADPRADIYALGVTLYECMTGCLPFGGATPIERLMAPLQSPPTPLRNLRPDASPYLEQIFDRMLARDPNQRPQDGDTAERWLAAAATSLHGDTPMETMAALPPIVTGATPNPTPALPSFPPPMGSVPPSHTAMDMVDSLDVVPTRRQPPRTKSRPWGWLALAVVMLGVGLGGGYWLSRDGRTASARVEDDERAPDDRDDRDDRKERKKTRRSPVSPPKNARTPSDVPHDYMPKKALCPGRHCELIPRKMWDGVPIEKALAWVDERAQEHYPNAKMALAVMPALRNGMVEPRNLEHSHVMVTYIVGSKRVMAHFMMARLSFKKGGDAKSLKAGASPLPNFNACPIEKAYGLVRGSLDEAWKTEGVSIQATFLKNTASPWTAVWVIDEDFVDISTCRRFVMK